MLASFGLKCLDRLGWLAWSGRSFCGFDQNINFNILTFFFNNFFVFLVFQWVGAVIFFRDVARNDIETFVCEFVIVSFFQNCFTRNNNRNRHNFHVG